MTEVVGSLPTVPSWQENVLAPTQNYIHAMFTIVRLKKIEDKAEICKNACHV